MKGGWEGDCFQLFFLSVGESRAGFGSDPIRTKSGFSGSGV